MERPIYFSIGSALHRGLEAYYTGANAAEVITQYFSENCPAPDDIEKLSEWDSAHRLSLAIMERYRSNYGNEPFTVCEIEKEFEIPVVNPVSGFASQTYLLAGKPDGLVKIGEIYWLLEHKTAGSINTVYKKKLTLDNQSILYVEAMERFHGIKIHGVLYNVMLKAVPHKPKLLKNGELSRDKNQNTTIELYEQAIKENFLNADDYGGFLEYLRCHGKKEFFYREYLTFSEDDRQQWRRELWDIAKDIRQCEINDRFYRNTAHCVGFGVCPYFDICTAPDTAFVIENSFQVLEKLHTELGQEADEVV